MNTTMMQRTTDRVLKSRLASVDCSDEMRACFFVIQRLRIYAPSSSIIITVQLWLWYSASARHARIVRVDWTLSSEPIRLYSMLYRHSLLFISSWLSVLICQTVYLENREGSEVFNSRCEAQLHTRHQLTWRSRRVQVTVLGCDVTKTQKLVNRQRSSKRFLC